MPAYYTFLIILIALLAITWLLMANNRNRVWVTAQEGIDPFDMWITLVPYIGLSLTSLFLGLLLYESGLGDAWGSLGTFLAVTSAILFIGSLAFALLAALIGGQTIPYPGYRPHWWKELRAYRLNHLSTKGLTSENDLANIDNLQIGLRTWPLPTNNPKAQTLNPHTKHTTRPINTSTMLEGRELPPYTYPTGPAPTACEVASWVFNVGSEFIYREHFPNKPIDRLRIRGTVTGNFTFTGIPPANVMLWRAQQKFFPQGPHLEPTNTRTVDLIIDHRGMYLVQTPGEDFTRRHAWVLGFTDISLNDVVFGEDEEGRRTLIFGAPGNGGYDTPVVFTAEKSLINRLKMRDARFERSMEPRSFANSLIFNSYWIGRQMPSAYGFEMSARPAKEELDYYHSMEVTQAQIDVINDRAARGMQLRADTNGHFVEVPKSTRADV